MDPRQLERQIALVLVTYRAERWRGYSGTMDAFRARARRVLTSIARDVEPYPHLRTALRDALVEIDDTSRDARSARAGQMERAS